MLEYFHGMRNIANLLEKRKIVPNTWQSDQYLKPFLPIFISINIIG